MKPFYVLLVTFLLLLVLLLPEDGRATDAGLISDEEAAAVNMSGLPLMFLEGQDPQTGRSRFQVRGGSGTIWLQDGFIWITLAPRLKPHPQGLGSLNEVIAAASGDGQPGVHLKLSFVGAESNLQAEPFNRLSTRVSTIRGRDPGQWQTQQAAWGGVRYPGLYRGVDLVVAGEEGRLRPYLIAGPDAALDQVRLRVEGADGITLEGDGLRLTTAAGDYTLPLFAVVRADGTAYGDVLPAPRQSGREIVTAPLAVGGVGDRPSAPQQYDIFYSTFLDGSGITRGYGIDVEPTTGLAYIVGATTASDFPSTTGAFDPFHNGQQDVFVVQLSSQGDALGFATFIGGARDDFGYGISLGPGGFVYVSGTTQSTDFPTTEDAYDRTHNGSEDLFILKLNPHGSALAYSTLVGGSGSDVPWDIAIDPAGQAFVAGSTLSATFPTTPGAYQTSYEGNRDAFVLKLNAAGSDLLYSSYLGGNDFDEILGLELDGLSAGSEALVAGATASRDFPTTSGSLDPDHNGGYDAFVARLNGDGSGLTFSTFLGGAGGDLAYGLALDGAGFGYVSGQTSSVNFPTTPGAFDRTLDGSADSFVARVTFDGSALGYATYLGGSDGEGKAYVAVDDVGMAYVTGETLSSDFPVTPGGNGNRNCGRDDAYALRLSASGSDLAFGVVLGGSAADNPVRAVMDNSNQAVYYTGYTESHDFPTTPGAFDSAGNSWPSAIAVKLALPVAFNGEIGTEGGTLHFGSTSYQFGAGTYTSDVFVVHAPLPDNPTLVVCGLPTASSPRAPDGALVTVGEPFDVTAVYTDSGQAALPSQPYTLTVSYNNSDLAGVVEDSLALYRWDGQQWEPEPGSVLDSEGNSVRTTSIVLGTWAVRGEARELEPFLFLPLITE